MNYPAWLEVLEQREGERETEREREREIVKIPLNKVSLGIVLNKEGIRAAAALDLFRLVCICNLYTCTFNAYAYINKRIYPYILNIRYLFSTI